jgi:DNA-binding NarL/FixJ family response regulator
MPGLDGLEAARRLKQAGCRSKLVFLTVWDDADYAREAMALGAAAYVVKSRLASDLPTAIADALADHPFVSPSISLCDLFPQVILKCDTVPLNGNEVTEPKINHQLKH